MSAESELRAALVANGALLAVVPAARISIDAVGQALAKPYIAFVKQGYAADLGLDNTLLADTSTIDIQCVGTDRPNAIVVRDLVRTALSLAGLPSDRGSAGYDPENDLEVEVVTVDWFDV
jgi:hypothetical protein